MYKAKHPSWRELEQFISFLSVQLFAFEKSPFCRTGDMSKNLPGMRSLVIKMMIDMSKVFKQGSCHVRRACCTFTGVHYAFSER